MQWWANAPDGLLSGRYRIEGKIGEGGMAEVFLARQQPLGNKVAIKVPKLGADESSHLLKRFHREVERQNQERIVGVVGLLDAGEWEGSDGHKRPYLVMEYVSGGSLADRLGGCFGAREHRQSVEQVLAWLTPIAATLDRLHRRGLLHRDVKPDNILFNIDGDPLLSDFGIATTFSDGPDANYSSSTSMWVVGSPGYMSPEILASEKVPASDQFSLGITVYEALSGAPPALPRNLGEWMRALASWRPQPISRLCPDVPLAVSDAVMQAISAERKSRFPDCSAFAARIREVQGDPRAPLPPPGNVGAPAGSNSQLQRARAITEGWRYVATDGGVEGPLPQPALRQLFHRGYLQAQSMVWATGMTEWLAYGDVFDQDLPPPVPPNREGPIAGSATPATLAIPIPALPASGSDAVSGGFSTANRVAFDAVDATLGQRFRARLIDAAMLVLAFIATLVVIQKDSGDAFWIALVIWWIPQAWYLSRDGQSIGKKAVDIRIVDAGTGANPGFIRAFATRELIFNLIWMTVLGLLIDIFPIFRAKRQCLHDQVVSTRVVASGKPVVRQNNG